MTQEIKLGISACLLGQKVRFDGGHKLDRFLTETLGGYVQFVPVCPEMECGLGIPRESMRLVGDPQAPRLVTTRTRQDHTRRMLDWAAQKVKALEEENLCGFIFKSKSPSSGMERVKVYGEKGVPAKEGVGVFARRFMAHFPLLPVEEEGRLHDPKLRETFIEQIFALKRWREAVAGPQSLGRLVDFHTQQKLLILSHSQKHYRLMGQLVAQGKKTPLDALYNQYEALLMEALRLKTSIKKNVNVLQHLLGYFKKQLSGDEKQELLELIDAYGKDYLPLIVPITVINHYVRKYRQPYLGIQTYLNPHPLALKLRNHA
jgi:uncharacterized protein YbgA (DUF1722 family)/uncharacterized protein YbbK (DUF523 family)